MLAIAVTEVKVSGRTHVLECLKPLIWQVRSLISMILGAVGGIRKVRVGAAGHQQNAVLNPIAWD